MRNRLPPISSLPMLCYRCPPFVAIRTNNITFRNFGQNRCFAIAGHNHATDCFVLYAANMVKFKHSNIRFFAIHARMRFEVVHYKNLAFCATLPLVIMFATSNERATFLT